MELNPAEIQTLLCMIDIVHPLAGVETALRDRLRVEFARLTNTPEPENVTRPFQTYKVAVCVTGVEKPSEALSYVERYMRVGMSIQTLAVPYGQRPGVSWYTQGVEPPD
jgi:hypothetical protein